MAGTGHRNTPPGTAIEYVFPVRRGATSRHQIPEIDRFGLLIRSKSRSKAWHLHCIQVPLERVRMKQKVLTAVILLFGLIGYAQSTQKSVPHQSIKVALDVVLVPVTVTDAQNRPVEGLRAENFHIWDDKVEEKIQYFSSEDTPVS